MIYRLDAIGLRTARAAGSEEERASDVESESEEDDE